MKTTLVLWNNLNPEPDWVSLSSSLASLCYASEEELNWVSNSEDEELTPSNLVEVLLQQRGAAPPEVQEAWKEWLKTGRLLPEAEDDYQRQKAYEKACEKAAEAESPAPSAPFGYQPSC